MKWIAKQKELLSNGPADFLIFDENDKHIATVSRLVSREDRKAIADAVAATPELIRLLKEVAFRAIFGPDDQELEAEAIALINRLDADILK